MTAAPAPHGRDTPVRRFLRSVRRWTSVLALSALGGLAPYAPPPPPPPVPRIEAMAKEDAMDDEDP